MVLAQSSSGKFFLVSTLLHFGLLAAVVLLIPKEDKIIPIEISYGTGKSVGANSSPSTAPKKQIQIPKQVITRPLAPKKTADDIAIAQEPQTKNFATSETNSSSDSAGSGQGTGLGNGSGEGLNTVRAKYGSMIAKLINDKKRYPRIAKTFHQEGKVVVKLKLDKLGKILELSVLEKSIYDSLTKASLETIQSVQQFPPIPDELGLEEISLSIPMNYTLQM